MPKEQIKPNELASTQVVNKLDHQQFKKRILRLSALSCNYHNTEHFDITEAEQKSQEGLKALRTDGALQEMLAAQMLSIHQLQQTFMALFMANDIDDQGWRQYLTNTVIKLTNCFTQQANLLAKLQGAGGQKIIVEHVEVHQGGQAVVGTINGGSPTHKEQK